MAAGVVAAGVLLAAPVLLPSPVGAQTEPAPPACDDEPLYHQMDFWVGEWDVLDPDGNTVGSNVIEKILDGCAILEHWTAAGGGEGKSLFYVDRVAGEWRQVWVTDTATRPGGMKEKRVVEVRADRGLRFQGEIPLTDGSVIHDRTTLTPLDDGRVRQHIQQSRDGETWPEGWVGIYVPRG